MPSRTRRFGENARRQNGAFAMALVRSEHMTTSAPPPLPPPPPPPPPPPSSPPVLVAAIVGDDSLMPSLVQGTRGHTATAVTRPAERQFERWNRRPLSAAPSPRPAGGLLQGGCRKAAPPADAFVRLPATSQLAASLQGPGGIEAAGRSFGQTPTSSATSSAASWQCLARSRASQDSALRPRSAQRSGEAECSASPPSPTRPAASGSPTRPPSGRARPQSPGKPPPPPYGGVWPHGDELMVWQGEQRCESQGARGRHEAGDAAQHGARAAVDAAQEAARLGACGGTGPGLDLGHVLGPRRAAAAAPSPPVQVHPPRRPASAAPASPAHSPRAPLVVPHVSGLLLGWRYPGEAAPGQLRGYSPRRSGGAPRRQSALLSGLPLQQGAWCADSGLPVGGGGGTRLVPARHGQPVGPPVMESSTATMHHRPAYEPRVHAHVLTHTRARPKQSKCARQLVTVGAL